MDDTLRSCREFVEILASAAPTPGGGGAAALVGAIGAALGNMVGSLTVGKPRYAAVEQKLLTLMAHCQTLQTQLLDQVQADAEGFAPLAAAYRMERDDPKRAQVLEQATLAACAPPLECMGLCVQALELVQGLADMGAKLALSDAGCAAVLLRAALQAASLNVRINTKALCDRALAAQKNAECARLLACGEQQAQAIYDQVCQALEDY